MMKKVLSFLLSIIMMFSVNSSVFATNNTTIEDATEFLYSYGFPIENPVAVNVLGDRVVFTLDYLITNEYSYISYEILEDGAIQVVVDEGNLSNIILFTINGIYIDGNQTHIYDNVSVMPLATYATSWSSSVPSGATSFTVNAGTYNSSYNFGSALNTLTVAVIKSGLASGFGAVSAYVAAFSYAANLISQYAINHYIGSSVVAYSGPITRCDANAPLQYFYKYHMTFLIEGGQVAIQDLYRTDTLC